MATTGSLAKIEIAAVGASPTYTEVPAVGTFSMSMNRPALDITAIGDLDSSYLSGVQTATGTLELFFQNTDANHSEFFDNINGAEAKFLLKLTLETGETITGTVQVTNFDLSVPAGDVVRATIQLQYSGAITNASA